ncbi:Retrovirus-related Pol polyprotein [Thelohanellus kitauei]|uniref:Retrovirus-related Pol polyprotein n=1 Tax=Thelohanellus kitauei TaxID=669202 RepID=A0A0C2IUE3_THEKT|nr:Retrovirus-related Pol polyprotein [Thelohanellus kitauei]
MEIKKKLSIDERGLMLFVNKNKKRIEVPESRTQEPAKRIHEIDCGQAGLAKSVQMIQRSHYWPDLMDTIRSTLQNCETCVRNKLNNPSLKHSLQPIQVNEVFSDWHVDFAGPLPETSSGNRYFIIFVDRLTKWVEAFPFVDQTAESAARTFVDKIVCRFGLPKSIHSDQGRQFEYLLFTQICDILGIQKNRSTAYHPQGNGMAERYVRT